ncbi:MAG: TIGR00645 family protein [Oceanospirillum sp.]|nr:TIGR00645 family protein [Oceanospirillum sp.]
MKIIETLIFRSRWLLAPFFLGLILALIVLLGKFLKELAHLFYNFFDITKNESLISILTLLDVTLIACLIVIIILSGYEIFVSRFTTIDDSKKPKWMGKTAFSDLKLKLITAIVAISSVELLRAIINIDNNTTEVMAWKAGVHVIFVFTGLFFALTDFIVSKKDQGH